MTNILFIAALSAFSFSLLAWGFRVLTKEEWQIALAKPIRITGTNEWKGVNYTYYGFFQALAFVVSVIVVCVLVMPIKTDISLKSLLLLIGSIPVISIAAAKSVARVVEKKKHTSTVAGGFFVTLLVAPWLIELVNHASGATVGLPVMPILAAATSAYLIGEGIGRLACISFGCCYGKPVSQLSPLLQKVFAGCAFTFKGKTKKIAYESGFDGMKVAPIQAITSVLLVSAGLAGVCLFLAGSYGASFLVATITGQTWRFLSERLRADYRGGGRVSAYQIMAIIAVSYAIVVWALLPQSAIGRVDVLVGIRLMWNPVAILALEALGVAVFLVFGRSTVTESLLTFYVRDDRI